MDRSNISLSYCTVCSPACGINLAGHYYDVSEDYSSVPLPRKQCTHIFKLKKM